MRSIRAKALDYKNSTAGDGPLLRIVSCCPVLDELADVEIVTPLDAYGFGNVSVCLKGNNSLLDKGLAASIEVNS